MIRCGQLFGFALLFAVCLPRAEADEARVIPEYVMKAAYLFNFAQLTEWPVAAGGAEDWFNACVFGQDELYAALEAFRGRPVGGQRLRPVRIVETAEARQCRLIFIGNGEPMRGVSLLGSLRSLPVLTVTDEARIARAGAIITLVVEQRRLFFEVNLDYARRAQLKFSSKLLRLAKSVIGE